jgi:hypothetical protein
MGGRQGRQQRKWKKNAKVERFREFTGPVTVRTGTDCALDAAGRKSFCNPLSLPSDCLSSYKNLLANEKLTQK